MQIEEAKIKDRSSGSLWSYLMVTKPRETGLLVFIGGITAVMAAGGVVAPGLLAFTLAAILLASAGANGLTNYLDRDLDARMQRTCRRVLPAGKIYPAEKALVFTSFLTLAGLVMAWHLHPVAFLADLVGTAAAVIYRKRATCVFPQGMIASCAPVLMGWFAVRSTFGWEVLLLCLLIVMWLPSHIWSIMIAHREDYRNAGITYFPLSCSKKTVTRILFAFSLLLYASSLGLFFVGSFGLIYLVTANLAGIVIVFASWKLMQTNASGDAWKLYKLSAFPYLGLVFLVISLDIWFRF